MMTRRSMSSVTKPPGGGWNRRRSLAAGAALCVKGVGLTEAKGEEPAQSCAALTIQTIELAGDRRFGRHACVLWPAQHAPGERFPVLVLLHGLAETKSESLGIRAWSEQ